MEPELELNLPGSEEGTLSVLKIRALAASGISQQQRWQRVHPPQVRRHCPPLTASNPHHGPRAVQKPAVLRGQVIASGHFTSK